MRIVSRRRAFFVLSAFHSKKHSLKTGLICSICCDICSFPGKPVKLTPEHLQFMHSFWLFLQIKLIIFTQSCIIKATLKFHQKGRVFFMPAFSVPLSKVAEQLNLETVYAPKELNEIPIYTADVNRPGIVLAGYYQYFDANRIQIFGMVEMSYLQELPAATRRAHLERLFELTPPAVLISRSLEPLPEMIDFARMYSVPVLSSAESTSTLMSALISLLNVELAPRVTRHGVFIEVYGEGILILGDSGVGKSETAVELVKRGHRLIADDAVELRRTSSRTIVGTAPENIRHFIELRGIGIVNVARIFGIGSVKVSEKVDLVVDLEPWDKTKNYSRTGLETDFYDILGVQIPKTVIPVMPGRNLAVILETAAINNRQKKMGYNAAKELLARLGLDEDIGI